MTKFQLFSALFASTQDGAILTINGERGIVQSVSREDGSGHCYNVIMFVYTLGTRRTYFVRTID